MTIASVTDITDEQKNYINNQIARIDSALFAIDRDTLTGKLSDLTKLQLVIDNVSDEHIPTSSIAFAFTDVFLNANPEYRWVSVNKETSSIAVQYLTSKIVWYPESSFSKLSIKDKAVREMYLDLIKHMRTLIISEGFYAD